MTASLVLQVENLKSKGNNLQNLYKMEHFKSFDPNAPPFLVECLFDEDDSPLSYDHLGFFLFPQRKGWGDAFSDTGVNLHRHSKLEIDQFLQSWLYLGFLSEWMSIAKLPLVVQRFVRKDDRGALDYYRVSAGLFPDVEKARGFLDPGTEPRSISTTQTGMPREVASFISGCRGDDNYIGRATRPLSGHYTMVL
jgi:hypothetical protein